MIKPAALALLLAALAAASARAAEPTLYAGPEQGPLFGEVAPELATALYPALRLRLMPTAGSEAALDRVAAEPGALAVVDLASAIAYAARRGLPPQQLEFTGELAHRCVLAYALRGGWPRGLGDLVAPQEGQGGGGRGDAARPTIGLAGAEAPAMLALLQRLDPGLEGLETQAGEAGPLAARVARGALDALLVVVHPEFDAELIADLDGRERLARLPVATRLLSRAAAGPESGFSLSTAAAGPTLLPRALMPWAAPPEPTLCAPVGVVARDDAPAAWREALPAAERAVAAALRRPGLGEHAMGVARDAARDALGAARDWLRRQ